MTLSINTEGTGLSAGDLQVLGYALQRGQLPRLRDLWLIGIEPSDTLDALLEICEQRNIEF